MSDALSQEGSEEDANWMARAIDLARLGEGSVEPNPMVGCVLVADGQCIGEGYHRRFGGPHAERDAIANARKSGNADLLPRATAYVTLEPCSHQGKTPPCTDAILDVGIQRVVVAQVDPFEQVAGSGIQQLRAQGVSVLVGTLAEQARALNAPYLKRVRTGLPWFIAKWAMTIDGKIATRSRHSQWISSSASRLRVHQWRSQVDAILVGSGTVKFDDPMLTARIETPPNRTAMRVVLDTHLAISEKSKLVATAHDAPVLLWAGPDCDQAKADALSALGVNVRRSAHNDPAESMLELLRYLASEHQVTNVLCEGGAGILGTAADHQIIDECRIFLGPKIAGGASALTPIGGQGVESMDQALMLPLNSVERLGENDVLCVYRRQPDSDLEERFDKQEPL